VAVPYRLSFKKAQDYFHSNMAWAKKSLNYIKKVEQEHITTVNNNPRFNKTKARATVTERFNYLADKYGFIFNRLFIRNQKTRWGSCSEKNNINLNINLARLTEELMDYVILHELAHLKIKNHSKQFWSELDKYVGNAKELDEKLWKHRLGLVVM
jgi:predicted metal-dependent hydrolase